MTLKEVQSDRNERDLASDAAVEWFVRLKAGDGSNELRGEFAEWLAASEHHKTAFDELLVLWDGLALAKDLPFSEIAVKRVAVKRFEGRRRFWFPATIAASLMLVVALLFAPSGTTYESEHGKITPLDLADGSHVHLNTSSRIEVDLSEQERSVRLLTGQAFFKVAKDLNRSFVVHTAHGDVRAIGTAFEVNTLNDQLEVTVTEGVVEVQTPLGKHHRAAAGRQVRVTDEQISEQGVDALAETAWREGRLVYDGVPLEQLIGDLNRYLPRRMTVVDDQLARTPVSAVLQLEDQELMLQALSLSLPLRWQSVSDNLILILAEKPG